jgi:hypothetical protein
VDFILATTKSAVGIDRIWKGDLEEDLPSTWVGDSEAFGAYERYYRASQPLHPDKLDESILTGCRMTDAFTAVIEKHATGTVGHFSIRVTSQPIERDGFRYLPYVAGHGFQPITNTTDPTSLLRTIGVAQR